MNEAIPASHSGVGSALRVPLLPINAGYFHLEIGHYFTVENSENMSASSNQIILLHHEWSRLYEIKPVRLTGANDRDGLVSSGWREK